MFKVFDYFRIVNPSLPVRRQRRVGVYFLPAHMSAYCWPLYHLYTGEILININVSPKYYTVLIVHTIFLEDGKEK